MVMAEAAVLIEAELSPQEPGVPKGYKQTEVGVIPEDWSAIPLGAFIASLDAGVSVNSIDQGEFGVGLPAVLKTSCVHSGRFDPSEAKQIISADLLRAKINPKHNSIIISRMNTPALVGECGYVEHDYPNLFLPDRLWLTRHENRLPHSVKWLSFVLSAPSLNRKLKDAATGTSGSMKNLPKSALLGIKIPSPPTKTEQDAIAEALSDTNALIESLERLIDKKRQIKQGAMQELLTGKRRLPDFSAEWKTKPIGSVLTIMHGKSQHEVAVADGPFPILATGGQIGKANAFLHDKPSVLIGRKGTIDRPQYIDKPFWTVDTLFYSILKEKNVAKYFYYRFLLIDWYAHNEASGVPSLNAKTIEKIELAMPEPEEQEAIVEILSSVDAEISYLEKKIAKACQIKQGMMRELLTGRVRLV